MQFRVFGDGYDSFPIRCSNTKLDGGRLPVDPEEVVKLAERTRPLPSQNDPLTRLDPKVGRWLKGRPRGYASANGPCLQYFRKGMHQIVLDSEVPTGLASPATPTTG